MAAGEPVRELIKTTDASCDLVGAKEGPKGLHFGKLSLPSSDVQSGLGDTPRLFL